MLKYVLKRLGLLVFTLFIIVSITFFLIRLMPGSPFDDALLSQDQIAVLQESYGLNDSIGQQYVRYMKNVLNGDFGQSFQSKKDVSELISARIPTTTRIGLQALLLGTIVGALIGIVGAVKKNSIWDYSATVTAVLGISVPSFIFAIGLQLMFGVNLKVLPVVYLRSEPFVSSILPTLALSVGVIATVARFMRSELLEVLGSDYVLLARAKGLEGRSVMGKHAIRNALIPIITIIGPMTVGLIAGSTVVERIFSVPGVGALLIDAVLTNDYFVIAGVAMFYSTLYLVALFVVDILYGIVDPRIRIAGGKG